MRTSLICLLALTGFLNAHISNAQIGKFLKEKAKNVSKSEALSNLKESVGDKLSNKLEEERAALDSTSFSYAISLNDNADFVETEGFKDQSVKWLSNLSNREDASESENARALLDMGELFYAKGYYKKAGDAFDKARVKYETNKLTDEPSYFKVIANIGLLYSTMGRYNLSEETTYQALKLREEAFGQEHPSYGASLNNLAVLQKETGRYNEAEKNISRSISVLKQHPETKEMPLAIALNNQAMINQSIGRYDQAQEILNRSIAISEKNQGKNSGNHQKFLTNMALLQQEMGNHQEAERLFLDLISIKKRRFGTNSPDYAHMLNNLAALYMEMGQYSKVEEQLKEAGDIYEKKFGNDHRLYAKSINDLGNFYRFQGNYDQAEPLLIEAEEIRKEQLGENHPEYVQSLEDLAIINWKNGDIEKAQTYYHKALTKSLAFINSYFPPMSEAEKTKYWDKLRPRFERFYAFATDAANSQPELLGEMYDYHIATKGLLLSATSKIKQKILHSGDEVLIKQYVEWLDQKETLALYYSYSKQELDEQDVNLDSLQQATNTNERQLSQQSSLFEDGYKLKTVSFNEVRSALKTNEAVAEILRLRNFDNVLMNEVGYAALILKPGYKLPTLRVLKNGNQMETRYFQYYNNAIQQKIQDDYTYDQYWAPLATDLAGSSNIYLSMDGIYNQINLNTLRTPSGSYVIDQYNLSFVGNSKELVVSERSSTAKKTAFLLGNPNFGGDEVAELPGTKKEIEEVNRALVARGYRVSKKTDNDATESSLKAVDNPKLLHIATHGYFLEDSQLGKAKVFGVSAESAKDNPLLRSGLLLAGASKAIDVQQSASLESSNNGVLTAYEAMSLQLDDTDIVILSACETAVGDIKAGEGVYGLQRAFLAAGANTLIMSLWKVDDTATQALMTSFCSNWLRYGNKKIAFKKAQLAIKNIYPEPYYWGAFVLIGD